MSPSDLATITQISLHDCAMEFERAFRDGGRPRVADYLDRPGVDRDELLLELLHVDLEKRVGAGEAVQVADYLKEFQALVARPDVVEQLLRTELAARRRAGHQLRREEYLALYPAFAAEVEKAFEADLLGSIRIDGFLVGEVIGKGGMGTVYRARDESMNRDVAVKVLQDRFGESSSAFRRFQDEARITGQLQHPGIPPVHEVGKLGDGRPYLIMKLIKGNTLAELLKARRSPDEDRGRFVEIFERIAQAVAYAHGRKVIHRDLKPQNVMVGAFGEVQVMDWGLAKVLGESAVSLPVDEKTAETSAQTVIDAPKRDNYGTVAGSAIGTPAYMSPEQAGGELDKIDRRSDVFGLGAILCEILTGRPPYTGSTAEEVRLKSIRGELGEAIAAIEACGAEAELRGLVRRCLSAKSVDRAEDAGAVADTVADLRAAVEARARLLEIERNKIEVREEERCRRLKLRTRLLSALAVSLLGGIAGSLAFAHSSRTAQSRAEIRLAQIELSNDILGSIFEKLDPQGVAKDWRPLQAILTEKMEEAAGRLDGEAIGDELVVARMQDRLGRSLMGLGSSSQAAGIQEKSLRTRVAMLGAEHPETLAGMNNLALSYEDAGQLGKASQLFEVVLDARMRALGANHPETLSSMNNMASCYRSSGKLEVALPLFEETLKRRMDVLGSDHLDTITSANNLAGACQDAGKFERAISLFKEALDLSKSKLNPGHAIILSTMNNLACAYEDAGQLEMATPLFETALQLRRTQLGPDHFATTQSVNSLGVNYHLRGKLNLAMPLLKESLEKQRSKQGPEHPATLKYMNNLAVCHQSLGMHDIALQMLEETLATRKRILGSGHPASLESMSNLAACHSFMKNYGSSLPLLLECLELHRSRWGARHHRTLAVMNNLASCYWSLGRFDLALPLYQRCLDLRMEALGPKHQDTISSMVALATGYQSSGQMDLAVRLYEESLRLSKDVLGVDHPFTMTSMNNLATAYRTSDDLAKALPIFEETLLMKKAKYGSSHSSTLNGMSNLGIAYCEAGMGAKAVVVIADYFHEYRLQPGFNKAALGIQLGWFGEALFKAAEFEAARTYLAECVCIRKELQPNSWLTYFTEVMLGGAALKCGDYIDAEPLLIAGYQGMVSREKTIPPTSANRIREAVILLIELHEQTGRSDTAEQWRGKLPKEVLPAPKRQVK